MTTEQPQSSTQPINRPPFDCALIVELIPAFSIGATDPDEAALVRAALPHCPDAKAELAAFARLNDALHHASPPASAPPGLLSRIIAELDSESMPGQTKPIPVSHTQARRRRLLAAIAAILLLALVGTNLFWLVRQDSLNTRIIALQHDQQARDAAIRLLSGAPDGPPARRIEIGPPDMPANLRPPAVTLVTDPSSTIAVLLVRDFPPLPPERAYQVWLGRGQTRANLGAFQVDAAGSATYIIRADMPLGTFERIGITPEPAGGSPAPTGSAIVRGVLDF